MNIKLNPNKRNLSISLPTFFTDMSEVEILDASGQLVFSKNLMAENEIQLEDIQLGNGKYFVKVRRGDLIFKKDLVV